MFIDLWPDATTLFARTHTHTPLFAIVGWRWQLCQAPSMSFITHDDVCSGNSTAIQ